MTQTSEFELAPSAPPSNHVSKATPAVVIQLQDHKAPGGGPRASKRTQWIRLAEVEDHAFYEHQILAQTYYPNEINVRFFSGSGQGNIVDGLRKLVVEHNGWLDADTGEVLPPVDEPCRRAAALAKEIEAEEVTHAVALKEARTEAAKATAELKHRDAKEKIYATVHQQQDEMSGRCCFWDAIGPDEISLMLRAILTARDSAVTFLLEKRISSSAT